MDSELKYIEGHSYLFDDFFWVKMREYSMIDNREITSQIESVTKFLPILNGWSQEVAGVVPGKNPIFFVVEYYNEDPEPTRIAPILFIDIIEIECDEYLDYINKKLSIKSYYEKRI